MLDMKHGYYVMNKIINNNNKQPLCEQLRSGKHPELFLKLNISTVKTFKTTTLSMVHLRINYYSI